MKSIVDTPEFLLLNPILLDGIRIAEAELRQVMVEFLAAFPAELQAALGPIVDEVPARFITSQLPLYRTVDDILRMHNDLAINVTSAIGPVQ